MVTATIIVQLEIQVHDTWNDDCTVGQVKKQALESARHMLRSTVGSIKNVHMISDPKCVSIHYKED